MEITPEAFDELVEQLYRTDYTTLYNLAEHLYARAENEPIVDRADVYSSLRAAVARAARAAKA